MRGWGGGWSGVGMGGVTPSGDFPNSGAKHPPSCAKHPTSRAKHPTRHTKHPTLGAKHSTLRAKHPTYCAKHSTSRAKHPTSRAKHPKFRNQSSRNPVAFFPIILSNLPTSRSMLSAVWSPRGAPRSPPFARSGAQCGVRAQWGQNPPFDPPPSNPLAGGFLAHIGSPLLRRSL